MFLLGMWFCSLSQLIIYGVQWGPFLALFEKRGEERNRKVKVKTAVSLLNPCASTACDIISFNGHGQLVAANLCKVKRSFKPYQNEHNSVKDTGEKGKTPRNIDLKISLKILFHCYPPAFPFR